MQRATSPSLQHLRRVPSPTAGWVAMEPAPGQAAERAGGPSQAAAQSTRALPKLTATPAGDPHPSTGSTPES